MDTFRARDLLRQMAEAAWLCGDPGMQYDTTVNNWHTSSATARINSSNPCSEYMYLMTRRATLFAEPYEVQKRRRRVRR